MQVAHRLAYRYQLRPGQATATQGGRFDAEYARALAMIARDGYLSEGVKGQPVVSPWVAIQREARSAIQRVRGAGRNCRTAALNAGHSWAW